MSIFTKFLNLFKYDPTTDKDKTFNITTALNDNWDKIDAKVKEIEDKTSNINAENIKLSDGKTIEGKFTEVQGNIGNITDPTLPVELKGKSLTEQTKQLFQSGLDGKNLLETSIKSKGGAVSKQGTVATFNELDLGIKSIETDKTGDATAVAGDILSGKTAYAKGNKLTGTMANRGAVTNTISTQNGSYTIPVGYHSGTGKVTATFANLIASNVRHGVNIGGIVGTVIDGTGMYKVASGVATSAKSGDLITMGLTFVPKILIYSAKHNARVGQITYAMYISPYLLHRFSDDADIYSVRLDYTRNDFSTRWNTYDWIPNATNFPFLCYYYASDLHTVRWTALG